SPPEPLKALARQRSGRSVLANRPTTRHCRARQRPVRPYHRLVQLRFRAPPVSGPSGRVNRPTAQRFSAGELPGRLGRFGPAWASTVPELTTPPTAARLKVAARCRLAAAAE